MRCAAGFSYLGVDRQCNLEVTERMFAGGRDRHDLPRRCESSGDRHIDAGRRPASHPDSRLDQARRKEPVAGREDGDHSSTAKLAIALWIGVFKGCLEPGVVQVSSRILAARSASDGEYRISALSMKLSEGSPPNFRCTACTIGMPRAMSHQQWNLIALKPCSLSSATASTYACSSFNNGVLA